MILCDLCGQAKECQQKQIEGKEYAAQPFDETTVRAIPPRYPSYDQALAATNQIGMEKMFAAYFLGQTNLLGNR